LKRIYYKIHQCCGLIAGIFILAMGLTGAVLVFHEEIQALEHRTLWSVENNRSVSIDKAYQTLTSVYPNRSIRLIRFSRSPKETLIFSVKSDGGGSLVFMHPAEGKILKVVDRNSTLVGWILDFHSSFQSGKAGMIIVFIVGWVFLISLITGVLFYGKNILRILLFKTTFRYRSKRALYSSLHKYVSVWALLLNFILAVTGILISFDNLEHHTTSKSVSQPIKFSLDSALNVLHKKYPEYTPTYIRYPTNSAKTLLINGKVTGQAFYWTQYYNEVKINPATGEISALRLTSEANAKTKIASVVGVLHLVEFESVLVKLLFCFAGLSAPLLTITGFFMWRAKSIKK
jgi:uncharacterized iron-regulated membrane protein